MKSIGLFIAQIVIVMLATWGLRGSAQEVGGRASGAGTPAPAAGAFKGEAETFAPLTDGKAPTTFQAMWAAFDPRAEPLKTEVLSEWEEQGVVLRVVRFHVGIFKGAPSKLAAVYGYPKDAVMRGERVPGLLQIHGGGQYADYNACVANAKRGYATVSIAWAGRISSPTYRLSPREVKLFWDDRTEDPAYRLTTDWGKVDAYHAPGRNPGNSFPSVKPAEWTLDQVESPRNSGWFLCAVAARRALTFLEQQPEVDAERLGVYGHSMGGKLTVMTASDERVKAAAPSCGGISDLQNKSPLYCSTLGDDVSLRQIACPIIFLSPANDFHGRIVDLPNAIADISSSQWRVTCSPHHNHQDTPPFEVATLLWFDHFLKRDFEFPATPTLKIELNSGAGVPIATVVPDATMPILMIDVFYTQQGRAMESEANIADVKSRFWHHAAAVKSETAWSSELSSIVPGKPLWVYANVLYRLPNPVSGAGYYYRTYTSDSVNLSSLLSMVSATDLAETGMRVKQETSRAIEDFEGDWQKEWFTYRVDEWPLTTHKLSAARWKAPGEAALAIDVTSTEANTLVVTVDDFAAESMLTGGVEWQTIVFRPTDFRNLEGGALSSWVGIRSLKLGHLETLRPKRASELQPRNVGQPWKGPPPRFRNLRWEVTSDQQ